MNRWRRHFFLQFGALLSLPVLSAPTTEPMPHLVLLGDSIFDNASYTGGQPDVISQVRDHLMPGWKASLLAVDGATTHTLGAQLARLPADASQLVLSIGGNDALGHSHLLDTPIKSSAQTFLQLADAVDNFERNYKKAVAACIRTGLPLVACTIYNGSFPDAAYQRRVAVALAAFNDAIVRTGVAQHLKVIELRHVCNQPEDYANPIEPSSTGGDKIARAIVHAVSERPEARRGAHVV